MNTSDQFQQLPDSKHAARVDKARDRPGLPSPHRQHAHRRLSSPQGAG